MYKLTLPPKFGRKYSHKYVSIYAYICIFHEQLVTFSDMHAFIVEHQNIQELRSHCIIVGKSSMKELHKPQEYINICIV